MKLFYAISSFIYEADETCALLGYYAETNGNFVPTFRYKLSVPSSGEPLKMGQPIGPIFRGSPEDGTDRLSRNFGTKLPLLAV